MFADTNESETVFAPVIQAGVEAFKVSHSVTSVNMKREIRGHLQPPWILYTAAKGLTVQKLLAYCKLSIWQVISSSVSQSVSLNFLKFNFFLKVYLWIPINCSAAKTHNCVFFPPKKKFKSKEGKNHPLPQDCFSLSKYFRLYCSTHSTEQLSEVSFLSPWHVCVYFKVQQTFPVIWGQRFGAQRRKSSHTAFNWKQLWH